MRNISIGWREAGAGKAVGCSSSERVSRLTNRMVTSSHLVTTLQLEVEGEKYSR